MSTPIKPPDNQSKPAQYKTTGHIEKGIELTN